MAQSGGATDKDPSIQSELKEAAAPIAAALRSDAGTIADEAKTVFSQVNDEASSQLSQLAEQAKDKVSEATDKVKGVAAEQKDLLAQQIGGVAEAMERVATDLEFNGSASAQYARMIADNADQLSSTIRDNDVDQIMSKTQNFGREQPVAFLGAAALLGFAASRFLLASANRAGRSSSSTAMKPNDKSLQPAHSAGRM